MQAGECVDCRKWFAALDTWADGAPVERPPCGHRPGQIDRTNSAIRPHDFCTLGLAFVRGSQNLMCWQVAVCQSVVMSTPVSVSSPWFRF